MSPPSPEAPAPWTSREAAAKRALQAWKRASGPQQGASRRVQAAREAARAAAGAAGDRNALVVAAGCALLAQLLPQVVGRGDVDDSDLGDALDDALHEVARRVVGERNLRIRAAAVLVLEACDEAGRQPPPALEDLRRFEQEDARAAVPKQQRQPKQRQQQAAKREQSRNRGGGSSRASPPPVAGAAAAAGRAKKGAKTSAVRRNSSSASLAKSDSSSRSGRGARDTSASPEGAKEAPPQEGVACQFCDLVSPDFADDEAMDAHYVNDCPMLMECPGCAQILDIQTLNEHLLTECELKQEFASCLNCGEAFHHSELDTRQTCGSNCVTMKKPNFAGRCPLCHCDIGPGDEGFKDHLLFDLGCPQNPRKLPR